MVQVYCNVGRTICYACLPGSSYAMSSLLYGSKLWLSKLHIETIWSRGMGQATSESIGFSASRDVNRVDLKLLSDGLADFNKKIAEFIEAEAPIAVFI